MDDLSQLFIVLDEDRLVVLDSFNEGKVAMFNGKCNRSLSVCISAVEVLSLQGSSQTEFLEQSRIDSLIKGELMQNVLEAPLLRALIEFLASLLSSLIELKVTCFDVSYLQQITDFNHGEAAEFKDIVKDFPDFI